MSAEEASVYSGSEPSDEEPTQFPRSLTPVGQIIRGLPHLGPTPHSLQEDAEERKTDKIRPKIAQKMNPDILLCPMDSFLTDYGPAKVEPHKVEKCIEYLISVGLLVPYEDGGHIWADYQSNPSAHSSTEPRVFSYLKKIVDKIFSWASRSKKPRRGNKFMYEMLPYTELASDIAGGNHKMDASILEPGGFIDSAKLQFSFSTVPNEFKKKVSTELVKENREQIAASVHHIFCEDLRRTHMFAITAEDERMAVWYFSRSHSVKSHSFDWIQQDVNKFVHLFLAFAFASPEELGIDPLVHKADPPPAAELTAKPSAEPTAKSTTKPTAKPTTKSTAKPTTKPTTKAAEEPTEEPAEESAPKKPAQQYIYELPMPAKPGKKPESRFFKTIQTVSDSRPYRLSGRATRIWRVVEIHSLEDQTPKDGTKDGKELILKDVWLDDNRPAEADNMDNIFAAIEKLITDSETKWGADWLDRLLSEDKRFLTFNDETKGSLRRLLSDGNYKSLFLTKECAWKGEPCKKLSPAARIPQVDIFLPQAAVEGSKAGDSTRTKVKSSRPIELVGNAPVPESKRHYRAKYRSRVVYKEVCTKLHEVGTLDAFMDIMLQTTEALLILFCAGWVHRDISSGNILVFDDNGSRKVKLADLEFAEEFKPVKHRHADPRTGTPFFIPYEIGKNKYNIDTLGLRNCDNPKESFAQQVGLSKDKASPNYPHYSRLKKFERIPRNKRIYSVPDTITANIPKAGETVRYNFQHDLEAVWWVILYFITACVPWNKSRARARVLFQPVFIPNDERSDAYKNKFNGEIEEYLHPFIRVAFSGHMERLRSSQMEQSLARELFGQLDVPASYSVIHNDFATAIRDLIAGRVYAVGAEVDEEGNPIEMDDEVSDEEEGPIEKDEEEEGPIEKDGEVDDEGKLIAKDEVDAGEKLLQQELMEQAKIEQELIEQAKIDPLAWKTLPLAPSRPLIGHTTGPVVAQPVVEQPVIAQPVIAQPVVDQGVIASRKRTRDNANEAQHEGPSGAVSNKRAKNAAK